MYRWKTSGGVLMAASLVAVHLTTVLSSHSSWRGDFHWGIQQLGSGLYLMVPVLLAVATMTPVMRGGVRTEQNLLPLSPRREQARGVVVDVVPVVVAHLAFVGWVLAVSRHHGGLVTGSALVVLVVQLVTIVFCVALGRAVGQLVAHPAAVVGVALIGTALVSYGEGLVRVSAGNSPYAGLRLDLGEYWVALAVLAACVAALLLGSTSTTVLATAVVGVIATSAVASVLLDEPTLRSTGELPARCATVDAVGVCVYPGYAFMLPDLVEQAEPVLNVFRDNGIEPHVERIVQTSPGLREQPGTVSVFLDQGSLQEGRLSPYLVASSVLQPVWCPRINDPQPLPEAFDLAQIRTFAWLQRRLGTITEKEYRLQAPEFSRLPDVQQKRAVQQFLDRNISCAGLS